MAGITTITSYSSLLPTTGSDVLDGVTTMTSKPTMEEKKYEDYTEVKVAIMIDRIYIPTVVLLGLVGNVLSFLTLVFSPLRHTSTCVYMAAIAVLDSVILVLDVCVLLRGYMGHTQFYLSSDWACGFHNFLFYFAIHFDVLLLLAMTVDRFIVVKFPLKAPRLCTSRSAVKATAGIGAFSFALNIQIFFTRRLGDSGNPDDPLKCWYPDPNVDYFMKKIYTWIDASIYSFIPCLSLLVLNVLIIKQLKSSRKFSRQFTDARGRKTTTCSTKTQSEENTATSEVETSVTDLNGSEDLNGTSDSQRPDKAPSGVSSDKRKGVFSISNNSSRKSAGSSSSVRRRQATNTNITVMFLLVSFTFLLLTSPVVIVLLYKRYYWLPSTAAERAEARLIHAVVDNLMYTNHAVNFLLYCVSGARFRQELKGLLAAMCCRR